MSFQNRENAPEESAGESISDLPFGPAGNPWNQNVPMHLLSLEVPNPSWKVFHFQDSPKKCLIVSPPVEEFSQLSYPKVGQLEDNDFQLLPIGMGNEQRLKALNQLAHHLKSKQNNFLGYQLNQEPLLYEEAITPFLSLHANNLGDPFINSNNLLNTKVMERAVLDYYASLWHGVWPHNPKNGESYWGSVLSMGASEGNLYGLWTARDYLCSDSADFSSSLQQARRGPSVAGQISQGKKAPVVFYSEDAHHSLIQAVDILGLKTFGQLGSLCYPHQNPLQPGQPWPREVPCHQGKKKGPGSIDINALAQLVEFFAHQGHPIIVCLTVGTGFKGGYDDVELAGQTLLPILAKYGLARLDVPTTVGQERRKGKEEAALDVALPDKYWFHVDGALGATYLPFLEMAYYSGRFALRPPVFDFRLPFVNSITTSFHKWLGMPWPAGLFMTKTKFRRQDASGIPLGTIFSGSRNALTPVMLWDFFARNSFEVLIEKAISSQEVAEYAVDQLRRLEKELGQDLLIGRAELSLSIRFKQVNDNIAAKYSLPEEVFQFGEEGGQAEHYSVIFVMNHVSKQLIDQLIGDLRTQGAFKSSSEFTEVKSRVHGRGFR